MSLDPKLLPPNVVRLMDPEEKKRLGYVSPERAKAKQDDKAERVLHDQVASLLRLRGVKFLGHSRMDKKTGRTEGEPDYEFAYKPPGYAHALPCAIELKRPGELPTKDQVLCQLDMVFDGWRVLTADNLEQVKEWLDSL